MDQNLIQALGFLGNACLILAYLPQIKKIIVTKKAEDISLLMWVIISLGDLCLLAYAIITGETVFTSLFTVFVIENFAVLYLTFKYGEKPSFLNKKTMENKPKSTPEKSAPEGENKL